ncbi:THAP domain-containing protein 10-like [Thalassophryne amazonica]|uniref:THAP domain-containing protein 10-like n=1 Tax=Thalassophryne amazonica TaxID=390379 RepID=UPI0014711F7B|nr:THAP domain-containing protein 10-like [Thalassophryne amazonica]
MWNLPVYSEMVNRCVVFGCSNVPKSGVVLHVFPVEKNQQDAWARFVKRTRKDFDGPTKKTAICSCHFTHDSFLNKMQYDMGLSKYLKLKTDATPSIYPESGRADPSPRVTSATMKLEVTQSNCPPFKHVSCQTDTENQSTRSVGTQLSTGTLQSVKSKAVQANVRSRDLGVGTTTFPLDNLQIFLQPTVTETSSKRPRLELKVEEEHDYS